MNRRTSLVALAALAAAAAGVRAQTPPRIPRVAFLLYGSRANFISRSDAFMKAMAKLGYVEGKTVAYDFRVANGQEDLLAAYAAEIGRSGADVVVSASTHTTRALKAAGIATPVVMGSAEDPIAEGFVKSLEKPGGNITGINATVLDQLDKHVELLFAVAPRLTRVTALLNPTNPTYRTYRGRLQSAVRPGTRLIFVDASTPEQIESAFPARVRDDADGLVVMNDTLFYNERRTLAEMAAHAKRPAVYPARGFVEAGGLMSWGPNPEANFTRAASYVDRILKGAKPAEMPVEQATRIELVVNREAFRAMGLAIPPEIQRQAIVLER